VERNLRLPIQSLQESTKARRMSQTSSSSKKKEQIFAAMGTNSSLPLRKGGDPPVYRTCEKVKLRPGNLHHCDTKQLPSGRKKEGKKRGSLLARPEGIKRWNSERRTRDHRTLEKPPRTSTKPLRSNSLPRTDRAK